MSAITINGKTYPVELTDLYVVRDLLDAVEAAKFADGSDIHSIIRFAELAKQAVSRAIGAEAAAEVFGDRLLLSVVKDAITQISDEVEPAYDDLLRTLEL